MKTTKWKNYRGGKNRKGFDLLGYTEKKFKQLESLNADISKPTKDLTPLEKMEVLKDRDVARQGKAKLVTKQAYVCQDTTVKSAIWNPKAKKIAGAKGARR